MNKLLALLLASTMVACAAESTETDESTPAEDTQQSSDELRLSYIDRNCGDPFKMWCPALGKCIRTSDVCRDPNDRIVGSFTLAR